MKKKKSEWTRLLRVVRQEWSRNSSDRKECFSRAKTFVDKIPKWRCAHCDNLFALSEVQCDHIFPIENTVPETMDEFLESFKRLHSKHLQILCMACHLRKTKQQYYDKKYRDTYNRVVAYLGHPIFVSVNLRSFDVLKKFDFVIKKIQTSSDDKAKKYLDQLDRLKEKYL